MDNSIIKLRDCAILDSRGNPTEEELVSADIIGDPRSGIVHALSTRVVQGRYHLNIVGQPDNHPIVILSGTQ